MIHYIERGNLFDSTADALINTVNCKGIMGKGIALEFKKRFPYCFSPYQKACKLGILKPGDILLVRPKSAYTRKHGGHYISGQTSLFEPPVVQETPSRELPTIIHMATKDHWRGNSKLEWIEKGAQSLYFECQKLAIRSLAMPPPGCGLGGLSWSAVKPIIEKYFSQNDDITVEVYLKAVRDQGESAPHFDMQKPV